MDSRLRGNDGYIFGALVPTLAFSVLFIDEGPSSAGHALAAYERVRFMALGVHSRRERLLRRQREIFPFRLRGICERSDRGVRVGFR